MIYDYVIVGAGSSGAVLAARLSADPAVQVALLEAGPDWRAADAPEAMASPNPYRLIVDPEFAPFRWDALMARRTRVQQPEVYWRGRGLGGSSAINGQIAIRGLVEDYDEWAALGCPGWSFAEVLPAFRRLETDLRFGEAPWHGDSGPIPIHRAPLAQWGAVDQALAEAALDAGHAWAPDHNAPGALGVSPYAINSLAGRRVSTNEAYLEPARGRNNLAIMGDALVDKVLLRGDRAYGVRVRIGGAWREIQGREIILAAGAVHSPAILLRSGIGPEGTLDALGVPVKADLPVGQGFQDHPAIFLPIALEPFAQPPAGFRHTNVCVRYSSGLPDAEPGDMMLVSLNRGGDSLASGLGAEAGVRGFVGVWVNRCHSRGEVSLSSTDPASQPMVNENMLDDGRDVARLRAGVRHLAGIAAGAALGELGKVELPPDLDNDAALDRWILANAGDTQHASSSCRMGPEGDSEAVVDPACRVKGVSNLRVIDASVPPFVVRANTHLTAVMIAEVMAERLAAGG